MEEMNIHSENPLPLPYEEERRKLSSHSSSYSPSKTSSIPIHASKEESAHDQNITTSSEDEYNQLLLETISNLQSELERSKQEVSIAKSENQILQSERTKLETKLSSIETRFNETKKTLMKVMDLSIGSNTTNTTCTNSNGNGNGNDSAHICTTTYSGTSFLSRREEELKYAEINWRKIVGKELNELEQQRKMYVDQMQEVDKIRGDIRQEMRKECEDYIESLVKEKEGWEEKYHTMKRNHDLLDVTNKVSIDTMTKEMQVLKEERKKEVSNLQESLVNHMEATADSTSELDQLRMDVAEANTQVEKMILVERELRKSLETAINERKNEEILKNEAISSYEMELTKMRSTISSKQSQSQELQNEVGYHKKMLDDTNLLLKHKSDQLTAERVKVSSLTSQLQQKENDLYQTKEDLNIEQSCVVTKLQHELSALKQENASFMRKKQIIDIQLSEGRAKSKQMKNDLVIKEETLRREMESNIGNIVVENSKLRLKCLELASTLKQKEIDHKTISEKIIHTNEVHKHTTNLTKRENDAMMKKCEILERSVDELKQTNEQTQRQLEEFSRNMIEQKKKLDISEDKLCDKQTELCILQRKLEKMSNDQREGEIKSLAEKEQLQSEITIIKSKLEKEQKEMKGILKEQEKNFKNKINKEKRKAECYREKAIDAHTKKLQVKHLLMQQEEKNQKRII